LNVVAHLDCAEGLTNNFVQHEYIRYSLIDVRTNVSKSAQGLIIAEKGALAEARDVFIRIGARVETATFEAMRAPGALQNRSSESYLFFVFYLDNQMPRQFSATLHNLRHTRKDHWLFYVAHQGTNLAFEIGLAVGRTLGESAEVASNVREARQLLKSWDAVITDPPSARKGTDMIGVRKRFGLTQDQMASALNLTTRTLQNWERNSGTSQMERKTKDLWELLNLMDDYIVAREESNWLNTANPAFKNKKPIELIVDGKLRDLIVEFQRLREGQPV
jgi:DNA-binding transcriptional regulator YiaG